MKTITKEYTINASLVNVYTALVDPLIIEKWSGSKAEMSAVNEAEFKLWDGGIHGVNIEVSENRIIQHWKEVNWKEFSKVTFNLQYTNNATHVLLVHEMIPDNAANGISKGWDEYYMGPLKELLEA